MYDMTFIITKNIHGTFDITSKTDEDGTRCTQNRYSVEKSDLFDQMADLTDLFVNVYHVDCKFEIH